jgi:hypothetical protein
MVQTRVVDNIVKRTCGSGLGIARSEHEPRDSGMHDGAGAHDARFERAIQRHAGQPVVRALKSGSTHRYDFGVTGGIVSRDRPVVPASHDLAFRHDKGANRHLPGCKRAAGFGQRLFHEIVIHCRMLNYSVMKPLRRFVPAILALSLFPLSGLAQGVRMPADFLPLDVGTRWTYDLTNETGQMVGQLAFGVEEYTIVQGTSFYALSEFPFTEEKGDPIQLVRYDRGERQFMRKRGTNEGPLFLDSGATTEVTEADAAGTAQKFVLRTDTMTLTFQRGVGIIEAKLKGPSGIVTAKMVSLEARNISNAGAAVARGNTNAQPAPAPPRATDRAIIPPPVPVPDRRANPTATVNSSNPRVDVGGSPSAEGHDLVMIATNTSDRLLPFRFGSGQTYDFVITDAAGKEVWRWSRGQFFTQVVRSDSIRARDKWRFDAVWDHRDNEGKKVVPGQYRLTGIIKSLPEVHAVPVTLDVR